MEGGNEKDYDEFEMLLEEIPNATSVNPPPEESNLAISSLNLTVASPKEEGEKFSPSGSFTNFYHASKAAKTSPNSASVTPTSSGPFPSIYCSLAFDIPPSACSSKSPYNQKHQSDGNLDGGSINRKNDHETAIANVDHDRDCLQIRPNLPDDQSLTAAFSSISFKDGPTNPKKEVYVQYKSLPDSAFLLEEQYPNCLNKSHSALETVPLTAPPSPNRVSCLNFPNPPSESLRTRNMHGTGYPSIIHTNGLAKIAEEISNQESSDLLKLNVHEIKNQASGSYPLLNSFSTDLAEHRQSIPVFSGQMPLVPGGITTFQVLPNGPVSGVEFPVSAFSQQFFLDAHSSPYIQSQHFSHPNTHMQQLSYSHLAWQHMEEERFRRMHQQQLYLQQVQNQGPGAHPVQASGNTAIGSLTRTSRQPYFDFHISPQINAGNRDPYWVNNAISRGFNQSDLAVVGGSLCCYHAQGFCGRGENCPFSHDPKQTVSSGLTCQSATFSAKDFPAIHAPDKEGKQVFPEKLLTRSHGLDSLRAIKPCSIGNIDSPNHANSNRLVFSNGNCHPSITKTGSFSLDGRSSRGSSPDKLELRLVSRSQQQQQKYNSLDEVAGRIYFMAKDQHGCRFLQRKFVDGTSEDVEKIFVEIIGHIVELMTDPFGNYLIQKLLEVCNEDHRMQILREITAKASELVSISCNMHGTRAVQKVIETLKTPEQYSMVLSALRPGILTLIKDLNGNHVVQRCLQCLTHEYSEFLFDAATAYCVDIATHRNGCCVLQKCLCYSDGEQRRRLVSEIALNALVLSQDPYGNYVVQYIFDLGISWASILVLDQLEGNYVYLSMQKYSSNVVEKCLKTAGEERRARIIQELMQYSRLGEILQDPFGNYVVQAALASSKGTLHAAFVEAIRPYVPSLRSSPYGKRVLSNTNLKNFLHEGSFELYI